MSAGGAVGYIINFITFSLMWSVFAKLFDVIAVQMNLYPTMPQDAFNTFFNLSLIYLAGPFLFAIALGINYLVQSNSESSGEV